MNMNFTSFTIQTINLKGYIAYASQNYTEQPSTPSQMI